MFKLKKIYDSNCPKVPVGLIDTLIDKYNFNVWIERIPGTKMTQQEIQMRTHLYCRSKGIPNPTPGFCGSISEYRPDGWHNLDEELECPEDGVSIMDILFVEKTGSFTLDPSQFINLTTKRNDLDAYADLLCSIASSRSHRVRWSHI